jgi:hypothetical protein
MTPKKDIVRRPVYTLDDGSPVPSMGEEFTMKESRFIFWYTHPGSEAFMNAGRAAVRAGYKKKYAVLQGYQLRQKPRIAKKINSLLEMSKQEIRDMVWRIAFLSRDRMFFDIRDFYRSCKRTVKICGVEQEVDSIEAIPLNEISERNRMCIDNVTIKTVYGKDEVFYKLPNREKAYKTFMKCYKILIPEENGEETDWQETAEIIRGNDREPVIAPRHGKAAENAIEAL